MVFPTGLLSPAVAMLSVGFIGCNKILIIIILTFGLGTSGFAMSGYGVNHLDIAPPFAGIF